MAGKACASAKPVRASVKPAVFTHISFAIVRVSAKEQQELAMCWRWDRVSKTYGSAIVTDTRTKGSKGLGHRPVGLGNSQNGKASERTMTGRMDEANTRMENMESLVESLTKRVSALESNKEGSTRMLGPG